MGVGHYENFPVASMLCPPKLRPAVRWIYRFARTADDIADEGQAGSAERLAELRDYRADLIAARAGGPTSGRWPQVFGAAAEVCATHALPQRLLLDLLDAFEQDVANPRYATREELMGYCSRSANPVGRLLLHLYGVSDAASAERSDAVCSALQLINFWQDLSVDVPRGRIYVPASDLAEAGLDWSDLAAPAHDAKLRAMIRGLCEWAAELMRRGAPLALELPGRIGWELRLVVQGGLRVVERIAATGFDSLNRRVVLRPVDLPLLLWRSVRMNGAGRP
jgi:squalene synthase HpnC